jgi:hypothetical protein
MVSVYSSGAIGRLVPGDAAGMIGYLREPRQPPQREGNMGRHEANIRFCSDPGIVRVDDQQGARTVQAQRDPTLAWRFISPRMINAAELRNHFPPEYETGCTTLADSAVRRRPEPRRTRPRRSRAAGRRDRRRGLRRCRRR